MSKNGDQQKEIDTLREELADVRKRYDFLKAALEHMPNPVFIKDADAKFFFFNKSYADAFGMERDRYLGKSVLQLDYLPSKDRKRYQKEDLELIRTGSIIEYEVDYKFADGGIHPSFYWSRGFYDEETGTRGLVGEIVDISKERELQDSLDNTVDELRESNSKLQKIAEIDAGTGVYNRILLNKKAKEFDEVGTGSGMTCGLMCDLDNFKRVNDMYGHLKGDEILQQFAGILQTECRENDIPIRYGGEEFLLLLSRANLKTGVSVAERIRRRCEQEVILPNGEAITVSIGVSMIDDGLNLEENILRLDSRMYMAKERGRNCIVYKDG